MKDIFFIVLAIVLVLLTIATFYLIWLNRDSRESIALFIKVAAAILVAVTLLTYELTTPVPKDTAKIKFLILRDKNLLIDLSRILSYSGSEHLKGYQTLYLLSLFGLNKKEVESIDKDKLFHGLVEASIWKWLADTYHLNWWALDRKIFQGISGGGGNVEQPRADETEKISYDINNQLSEIMPGLRVNSFHDISLPKGTNVNVKRIGSGYVEITFSNIHMDLSITLYHVGNAGVLGTRLGDELLKKLPKSDEYYSWNYFISIEAKYNPWLKWSPETNRQRKWAKELIELMRNDFDWDLVKKDLEKEILNN